MFRRALIFGLASGLLWSIAPGVLLVYYRSNPLATVLASVAVGICTSTVLSLFLRRMATPGTLALGLASLPFGAFLFGLAFSIFRFCIVSIEGHSSSLRPFAGALECASLSVSTPYAIVLLPVAAATTLLLKAFVWNREKSQLD